MQIIKPIFLLIVALLLSSCTTIKGWFGMNERYQAEDQNITPINVPSDLSSSRIHNQYNIQGTEGSSGVYRPVGRQAAPKEVISSGSMLEHYQQKRMNEADVQQTQSPSQPAVPGRESVQTARPVG